MINAFIKAINSENAKGLFNITSGKRLTLLEEAQTIAKVFWGDKTNPVIIEKPEIANHIDSFVYDINRAKNELDWAPEFSFEDMLYDFIKEGDSNTFGYLIEKRKQLLKDGN